MHSTLTLHGYMYMDKIAFVISVIMGDSLWNCNYKEQMIILCTVDSCTVYALHTKPSLHREHYCLNYNWIFCKWLTLESSRVSLVSIPSMKVPTRALASSKLTSNTPLKHYENTMFISVYTVTHITYLPAPVFNIGLSSIPMQHTWCTVIWMHLRERLCTALCPSPPTNQ